MDCIIRKVKPGDESMIAYITTESWRTAFRHILSAEVLQKNTEINKVTAMYKRLLDEGVGNGYILEAEGSPHCIAWWDKTRENDMPGYAELIAIHSLQNNWGKGYGTKMMNEVLADIVKAGYKKVMLWVFADNHRARGFYEACGFVTNGKVKTTFEAQEICYEKVL